MSGEGARKVLGRVWFAARPALFELLFEAVWEVLWLLPEIVSYLLCGGIWP